MTVWHPAGFSNEGEKYIHIHIYMDICGEKMRRHYADCLPLTTSDICSPPPPHLLLCVSTVILHTAILLIFLSLFQCSFLTLHFYASFCSFPQRSASTHILWLQNAGDNEVSGKRGLGGVTGIIPVV